MAVARYEIRIRGRISAWARSLFPDVTFVTEPPNTVLTGVFDDQAALYGALLEVERLGLELREIRPVHLDEATA
jgi:hypothetical protein